MAEVEESKVKNVQIVPPIADEAEKLESSENILDGNTELDEDVSFEDVMSIVDHSDSEIEDRSKESSIGSDESEENVFAEIGQPPKREKLVRQPDFFQVLGRVPKLDEISLTESIMRELAIARGEIIIEESIEEEELAEEEQEEIPLVEEQKAEEEQPTTEYSEYEFESSEEEEAPKTVTVLIEEDPFAAFIAEEEPILLEQIDFELLARMEEARQLERDVHHFMQNLIEAVVEFAEYVDPEQVLRENLDKVKLFENLVDALKEMQIERKIGEFLNSKCVLYYKRGKSLTPMLPDIPENLQREKSKFKTAIAELNALLGRQNADAIVIQKRTNAIEAERMAMEDKMRADILALETLIRKTFSRREIPTFNIFVDRRLKEMANLRQDISSMRNRLIETQHTKGRLLDKLANMEMITDTLRLSDYERLRSEEYMLNKKIEEKTERLDLWRHRFNCNVNTVAHMREKKNMLFENIQAQADILAEVSSEKKSLRAYIFQMERKHLRMHKEITEISFQCGLIDKPVLLFDYDDTEERISELKEKVDKMKNEINRKDAKIKRCTKSK